MKSDKARVFAKKLGHNVEVVYRTAASELDSIRDQETKALVAQKLERHRQLMTDIFAQLITVGAPLGVAMKFLPKDAVVQVCDTAAAKPSEWNVLPLGRLPQA